MAAMLKITRRKILGCLLAGVCLLCRGIRGKAVAVAAAIPPGADTPLEEMMGSFTGLSEALTDLGAVITQDFPDLKATYLQTLVHMTKDKYPGQVKSLLNWYEQQKKAGTSAEVIADTILNYPGPLYTRQSKLARSIMSMWYLGVWHDPEADSPGRFTVISSQTYIGGQVWRLTEAHPLGFSETFYGSWGAPPPQGS